MRPTEILIMIVKLAVMGGIAVLFSACAGDTEGSRLPGPDGTGIEVTMRAPEDLSDLYGNMDFSLYIFSRDKGSDAEYMLDESLTLTASGQRVVMPLSELDAREYRFLFLGMDNSGRMPEVVNSGRLSGNDAVLAAGDNWSDLRIRYTYQDAASADDDPESPSIDNYYDVVDMTGGEIIAANEISGDLKRFVGQLGFDFFKGTGPGAPLDVDKYIDGQNYDNEKREYIVDPLTGLGRMETEEEVAERVDNMLVGTIMDRIYMVEIEYTGMSDLLRFENDGSGFVPVSDRTTGFSLVQHLKTTLGEDVTTKFRYYIPRQEQPAIMSAGRAAGDARVKGLYFLPSEDMSVTFTVHYYDTTCSADDGSGLSFAHDESCYDKRQFSLSVPQPGNTLGVSADKMTLTRAAVPCNRIIDLQRSGGFIVTDHLWTLN